MDDKKLKNISNNLLNIRKEEFKKISDKLLNIKAEIKHVAKDAFEDKNKLNDDELKNVCAIFDAFSRSEFSLVKKIGNYYKGCFHRDGIGGCSKNEKEAIKCFEIAAMGDNEEAKEAKKQLILKFYLFSFLN
ncbi:4682_t:CDS:2 [Gigaspora margarita]|uniref:4682_t:CDS:1 n=1 Tax=Gigaspora margarita TaxID=4874 RepID=A0ABN7W518_GIGMA|nr:4682_t:CDS:2 [Gigaspora margarita]